MPIINFHIDLLVPLSLVSQPLFQNSFINCMNRCAVGSYYSISTSKVLKDLKQVTSISYVTSCTIVNVSVLAGLVCCVTVKCHQIQADIRCILSRSRFRFRRSPI